MAGTSRFDCYPSDFLGGTIGLSSDQIAVYTIVIMLQYDRGEPVPYGGKEKALAVRAGLSTRRLKAAVESLVEDGKFTLDGGRLSNPRVEKELEKIAAKAAMNRGNGALGGQKTASKFGKKSAKNSEKNEKNSEKNPESFKAAECERTASDKENKAPDEATAGADARAVWYIPSTFYLRPSSKEIKKDNHHQPKGLSPSPEGGGVGRRISRIELDRMEHELRLAAGCHNSPNPCLADLSPILGLLDQGADFEIDVLPAIRARPNPEARSWGYFVPQIQRARAKRKAAANAPIPKSVNTPRGESRRYVPAI